MTARVATAMLAVWLIRVRTLPAVVVPVLVGVALAIIAFIVGGTFGIVLGVLAVLILGVGCVMIAMRWALVAIVRRSVGGAEFGLVAPVLKGHMSELQKAAEQLPINKLGVLKTLFQARRPAVFGALVRDNAAMLLRLVPAVLDDVRRVIAAKDSA